MAVIKTNLGEYRDFTSQVPCVISIGRDEGNVIRVPDKSVSRRHVLISLTKVGDARGSKVNATISLVDGDNPRMNVRIR